jgi:hypothetical protein
MMLAMKLASDLARFYFFYFGVLTQPRLSPMGRSATACEA